MQDDTDVIQPEAGSELTHDSSIRPVASDGTLSASAATYEAIKDKPDDELTRDERRVKNYYEAQAARKEQTAKRRELQRVQKEQDKDYPKLTPQEWKKKYGTDKPKRGLIAEADAVRIVSRRMTAMALHTLAQICENSPNDAARVRAANAILERGWGKAHLAPEGETRPASEITVVFGNQSTMEQAQAPQIDHDEDYYDAEATETEE